MRTLEGVKPPQTCSETRRHKDNTKPSWNPLKLQRLRTAGLWHLHISCMHPTAEVHRLMVWLKWPFAIGKWKRRCLHYIHMFGNVPKNPTQDFTLLQYAVQEVGRQVVVFRWFALTCEKVPMIVHMQDKRAIVKKRKKCNQSSLFYCIRPLKHIVLRMVSNILA